MCVGTYRRKSDRQTDRQTNYFIFKTTFELRGCLFLKVSFLMFRIIKKRNENLYTNFVTDWRIAGQTEKWLIESRTTRLKIEVDHYITNCMCNEKCMLEQSTNERVHRMRWIKRIAGTKSKIYRSNRLIKRPKVYSIESLYCNRDGC